jgi:hypothetical protein
MSAALLERRAYPCELGIQAGADTVDGGNDHNADTGCDKTILDSRRSGFILQETQKRLGHIEGPVKARCPTYGDVGPRRIT